MHGYGRTVGLGRDEVSTCRRRRVVYGGRAGDDDGDLRRGTCCRRPARLPNNPYRPCYQIILCREDGVATPHTPNRVTTPHVQAPGRCIGMHWAGGGSTVDRAAGTCIFPPFSIWSRTLSKPRSRSRHTEASTDPTHRPTPPYQDKQQQMGSAGATARIGAPIHGAARRPCSHVRRGCACAG